MKAISPSFTDTNHVPMQPLFIVEDDVQLANLIGEYLGEFGYASEIIDNGLVAERAILEQDPPLVILDLMLPGQDGFSLCRRVRPRFSKPILILTARGDQVDEILGLELGADDYLVKPVEPRRLISRVRALLRRSQLATSSEGVGELSFHGLKIYPGSRMVTLNGESLALTTPQYDLLFLLASNAGRILSRQEILSDTRGIDYDGQSRTVDIIISQLRAMIESDPGKPSRIKTVRNKGYLFSNS